MRSVADRCLIKTLRLRDISDRLARKLWGCKCKFLYAGPQEFLPRTVTFMRDIDNLPKPCFEHVIWHILLDLRLISPGSFVKLTFVCFVGSMRLRILRQIHLDVLISHMISRFTLKIQAFKIFRCFNLILSCILSWWFCLYLTKFAGKIKVKIDIPDIHYARNRPFWILSEQINNVVLGGGLGIENGSSNWSPTYD